MTITRNQNGHWELRTRYGTLVATGDLTTVINTWARMRRDGWSDTPYGEPVLVNGRRTVECTERHDCECRACSTRPTGGSTPPARGVNDEGGRTGDVGRGAGGQETVSVVSAGGRAAH